MNEEEPESMALLPTGSIREMIYTIRGELLNQFLDIEGLPEDAYELIKTGVTTLCDHIDIELDDIDKEHAMFEKAMDEEMERAPDGARYSDVLDSVKANIAFQKSMDQQPTKGESDE